MLKKFNTDSPLLVSTFAKHSQLKDQLLELINKENLGNSHTEYDSISVTDFFQQDNMKYDYYQFIKPALAEHMKEVFSFFNVQGFAIGNMWTQQYNKNDTHHWHIHGSCHFTNVYLVELPDDELCTEVRTLDGQNKIEYTATEGDIITFPSYLYHRSPKNVSEHRKTIISFNMNLL